MRLAIIDHAEHRLFVEDVDSSIIGGQYGGNEEDYIRDRYDFAGEFSWDYICGAEYILDDGAPVEIDFEDIRDID